MSLSESGRDADIRHVEEQGHHGKRRGISGMFVLGTHSCFHYDDTVIMHSEP